MPTCVVTQKRRPTISLFVEPTERFRVSPIRSWVPENYFPSGPLRQDEPYRNRRTSNTDWGSRSTFIID